MHTKVSKSRLLLMAVCLAANLVNSAPDIGFRIVGGTAASEGEFPFMVSIQRDGRHICGGSLIGKEWVLSAAECFDGILSPLEIVAGTTKLDSNKSTTIPVAYIVTHGDYIPEYLSNNIALLRLSKCVDESQVIKVVEMENKYVNESLDCVAVGWGATKLPSSGVSNELNYLETKSLSMDKCEEKLREFATLFVSDICTFTKADEGYCQGDVGSPLVIKEGKDLKLIGVINWGVPCAKGYPDVSSRISYYYDWIKMVMESYH